MVIKRFCVLGCVNFVVLNFKTSKTKPPPQVERESNCQASGPPRITEESQSVTSPMNIAQSSYYNFSSVVMSGLKSPSQKYTGEKMLMCPHCPYKTARKDYLKQHINTHTGERPYACPHCTYTASQRMTLKNHILRHTGEKPFACPHCDYRAARRSTLQYHLTTHQGGNTTPATPTFTE